MIITDNLPRRSQVTLKMDRRLSLPSGPERKFTVFHSTKSHDELQDGLRSRSGSIDIAISPVVSLKKRVPRFRRASKFFAAMHFVRKFSSLNQNDSNNMEIVTPFAQILAKLSSIQRYLSQDIKGMSRKQSLNKEIAIPELELKTELMNLEGKIGDNDMQIDRHKSLNDVVWCLEVLKKMQTQCSVSEMTINEFRKVLYEKQMSTESEAAHEVFEFLKTYDQDNSDSTSSSSMSRTNSRNHSVCSDPDKFRRSSSATGNSVEILVQENEEKENIDEMNILSSSQKDTHRQEFHGLIHHGVISFELMNEELTSLLQNQDSWGMDVFHLSNLTNNRPLVVLAYTIFQGRDLINLLKVKEQTFINFFSSLEESYCRNKVPYHNNKHGADVMQSTHVLLNSKTLKNVFSPLEVLAALFAAAVHDADHPGVTNQYLVNTQSDLALMYNDISVLENHHVATAFKLLRQEGCNIFEYLTKDEWHKLRKLTIDIVLATDMSKHTSLMATMKTMIETQLVDSSKGGHLYLDNYSSKSLILQNMIHCADLSNPTKPLALYRQWTSNILQEFFQQGDKEREMSLNISPNCDRHKVSVNESQIGFIDYIVRPVWDTWSDLVHPDVQEMLDVLDENRKWHEADSNVLPKFSKISLGSSFNDLKEEQEG